mgnify:FL=1|tara:strand:- start:23099 stop:25534 length:2436 start_codon:yes stop_codon:yes gene_type:complete
MNCVCNICGANFTSKLALAFYSIFSICCFNTLGQNCDNKLSIEVIDLHDGSSLVNTNIYFEEIDIGGKTDQNGIIVFENLCDGSYTLSVSHEDCETSTIRVIVKKDTYKKVYLEHHLNELQEIIVTSSNRVNSKSLFENKISKEVLDDYNSRTLGEVLQTVTGVSTLNSGSYLSKPVINGLHSSRVILINNDVRLEDQEWGIEHAPSIDVNSIDKLSVIKGASALQYAGDAVGGVIIAETSNEKLVDDLYGSVTTKLQSNGRGGSVSTNFTKTKSNGWYYKFQGTLKQMGDFETADYFMTNTGFQENNISLKAGLNRIDHGFEIYYSLFSNQLGILRSSHVHTAIDIINAINNEIPSVIEEFSYDINIPRQKISHNLVKIKAFKNFNFGKLSMRYDYQVNDRKEFDIRRGGRTNPVLDLNLQTHALALDLQSKFDSSSNFKAGISGRYQKNFPDPATGVKRIIPDYKKYDFSFYSIYDTTFNKDWLVEAGIRYDFSHINSYKYYRTSLWELRNYNELFPEFLVEDLGTNTLTNPKFDFHNISSNLGVRYSINEGENIYLNYSISSRKPNPSELFSEGLHHSSARIEIGDLSFQSEVGNNISLTYNLSNEKSALTFNSFINYVNDFIYIIPVRTTTTLAGVFPVWEYMQSDANLYGFDVKYDKQYFDNFFIGHQFSLVKGYERSNDKPLINMPPANLKNSISYNFLDFNNLNISLESEYVFEQNEYPDTNFEIYIPTSQTYAMLDTSTPPQAYHLLNLSSSIQFGSKNGGEYKINVRVENLFNNLYKDYLNRLRYFTHDMGRNIMLSLNYNY